MKRIVDIKSLAIACLLLVVPTVLAADMPPETLTQRDLANHPERWPAQVTILKGMRFDGGNALRAGQKVRLVELQGADVVIDAGKNNMVAIGPEDCDLVVAANKAWSALTPAQRAVDGPALVKDASLWPDKVNCLVAFDLTDGKSITPGQELTLISVDQQGAVVYCANPEARLNARLSDTDLITRARERAAIDPANRKSRIVETLHSNMIDVTGKPSENAALDDAKVIVLYHGASWCQPCHKFSPSLVKFANDASPANPKLFFVMLSADDKDPDLLAYATDGKMPWPLVPKATIEKQPYLKGLFGNFIPQIVVLDHYGKVLANSDANGRSDTAGAMRVLASVVRSGAAK
jgi:thiol-disulfide isomerase/thioredoxin